MPEETKPAKETKKAKADAAEPTFDAEHNRRGRMAAHVAQGLLSRENIPDAEIPKKTRELTDAILKELDK